MSVHFNEDVQTLIKSISVEDFTDFYWLKDELVKFCKCEQLNSSGSKIEISTRIVKYLETGQKPIEQIKKKVKPKSKFNWKDGTLTLNTTITDNYKNTENVRLFFQKHIGKNFKFNVKFMNWMRSNVGKTLHDAIQEWKRIKVATKTSNKPKEIAPQFEYNTYLRDFLADNPHLKRNQGVQLWKIKKSLRGDNVYNKEDLKYLEN